MTFIAPPEHGGTSMWQYRGDLSASPGLIHRVSIGTSLLDAAPISLLMSASIAPQNVVNWNRKFRSPLACPSKLAGFPMPFGSTARASFCLASSSAARVSAANAADSAWCNCSDLRFAAVPAQLPRPPPVQRPSTEVHGAQRCSATLWDVVCA